MGLKFIVTGYSRHGKDEVAAFLAKSMDSSFESSSHWMLHNHLWELRGVATDSGVESPLVVINKGGTEESEELDYQTLEDMYEDRDNHREWWKDMIKEINTLNGLDYLGSNILTAHDIYCGLRDFEELEAIKVWASKAGHTLMIIFVAAPHRVPVQKYDREGGLTIIPSDCHLTIHNDSSIEQLHSMLQYYVDIDFDIATYS